MTDADRQRLQAARGFSKTTNPWQEASEGKLALQRGSMGSTSGFCVFLDAGQRCVVYEHRPHQCRSYPYLWTAYTQQELDVDYSCPGLGSGTDALEKWRRPPIESPEQQAQRERVIQELQDLLRAQQRYAASEILTALGTLFLDALAALWPLGIMGVNQTRPLFYNAETEADLTALWEEFLRREQPLLRPQAVESLLADAAFLEQHFGHPRWNTRLGQDGQVSVYRFWMSDTTLYLESRDGTRQTLPLGEIEQLRWQPEALVARRVYLERWLKRQLPVRLANNTALASLPQWGHVATCYLQFLSEIDRRLAVLAPALAQANGQREIGRAEALEAIRGSDGLLRTWCESARLGMAVDSQALRNEVL
jgi:Fe-S-cluster containining protein